MSSQPACRTRHDPVVERALAEHGADLVAIFRSIHAERGYLTTEAITNVADTLKLPRERAFGVASFYSMFSTQPRAANLIRVCDSPACQWQGAAAVRAAFEAAAGQDWTVERTSCLGLCDCPPAALIREDPCGSLTCARAGDALQSWRGQIPTYAKPLPGEVRVSMARIGTVDPDSLDSAIEAGAYQALRIALTSAPAAVLDIVEDAGLQGRGGAGFPLGHKWRLVAQADGAVKYVVCNFDESEPGTFKDRVIGAGDPHLLLEGMALGAYAVGASEGYIYIRGEYEWIAQRLERAMAQAAERGWLGANIQDGSFSFKVHVHRGAGAYICGEESALLESLEGRRGEPRVRPPYPTTHGYADKPTLVNNVESFCTVPALVQRGPEWYRSMGTANSPGVKVFTVLGDVEQPCAFEAPFGITLRRIIDQFGGGMKGGSQFKMALTGGAAGTIVPDSMLDVPMDTASWRHGLSLGSGAMFILDTSGSAVKLLYELLRFFEVESCGKCTPCREGTRETRIIVERIAKGQGRAGDVDALRRLAKMLHGASFCGLGQSVALPIESALAHFGNEFTHVPS
jgi:NADH:ubiquinone oxidoreductase subunit F (NADH-binding)/NADH:ubiquinone oxidoreductase subunit E